MKIEYATKLGYVLLLIGGIIVFAFRGLAGSIIGACLATIGYGVALPAIVTSICMTNYYLAKWNTQVWGKSRMRYVRIIWFIKLIVIIFPVYPYIMGGARALGGWHIAVLFFIGVLCVWYTRFFLREARSYKSLDANHKAIMRYLITIEIDEIMGGKKSSFCGFLFPRLTKLFVKKSSGCIQSSEKSVTTSSECGMASESEYIQDSLDPEQKKIDTNRRTLYKDIFNKYPAMSYDEFLEKIKDSIYRKELICRGLWGLDPDDCSAFNDDMWAQMLGFNNEVVEPCDSEIETNVEANEKHEIDNRSRDLAKKLNISESNINLYERLLDRMISSGMSGDFSNDISDGVPDDDEWLRYCQYRMQESMNRINNLPAHERDAALNFSRELTEQLINDEWKKKNSNG